MANVVTGSAFFLVDKDNNPRGAFALDQDGAALLQFSDSSGKTKLQVGVRNDGSAGFGILDSNGRERLTIDVLGDGACLMQFSDGKGNTRFQVHTADDGTASFVMWDSYRRSPITAKINSDGTYGCTLDTNDQPVSSRPNLRVVKPDETDKPK